MKRAAAGAVAAAIWVAGAVAVTASPAVARACPACAANQVDQTAYLLPTLLLLLVPIALVGGLVAWLALARRRADAAGEARAGRQ